MFIKLNLVIEIDFTLVINEQRRFGTSSTYSGTLLFYDTVNKVIIYYNTYRLFLVPNIPFNEIMLLYIRLSKITLVSYVA